MPAMIIGGAIAGALLYEAAYLFQKHDWKVWRYIAFGPPLVMSALLLSFVVKIGIAGTEMDDHVREWWSRLGAWLLIYSLVWLGLCSVAFYSTWLFSKLSGWLGALGGATWIASTIAGLLAARDPATGPKKPNPLLDAVAKAAPYVFIVGMLCGVAFGIDSLLAATYGRLPEGVAEKVIDVSPHTTIWWFFLGFSVVAWGLSCRVDINQFSMHLMYRNRLLRCYLGASNRNRRNAFPVQPFTGLDPDDDLKLNDFYPDQTVSPGGRLKQQYRGPFHIINTALNLVGGDELAWQQRKAASFVFTPRNCGYDFPEEPPGFIPTPAYANQRGPITLGTALAISGAAASPNMGYHSSPAATFLMTVFNVRLGWWLGNTRHPTSYGRSGPRVVLLHLLCELFGLTKPGAPYIYLSDGGHFENLGVYELVRRRCRYIVACDAEEDGKFEFGGLGNAIEKCRADLGIDIEIDVEKIRRRDERGHSGWHCAVGRIRYDKVDADAPRGTLLYLKSSLTGDEPTDVLRYAAQHPDFPHQSTEDQWFDESQFESYRMLGFHATTEVFGAIDVPEKLSAKSNEALFVALTHHWWPPSAHVAASFTRHTETLDAIFDRLRSDSSLHFLHPQIYPEWDNLVKHRDAPAAAPLSEAPGAEELERQRFPTKPEEVRQGFYLCNMMIQLMENVYLDLHLEHDYAHPDNRGWMNLFMHWAWSPTFRVVWTVSACTYGARFQKFCHLRLGLHMGKVRTTRTIRLRPGPEASDDLARARHTHLLNPHEVSIITAFLQNAQPTQKIRLLQIDPDRNTSHLFTFGFALVNDGRITYFRVQDHLRKMGLGREALKGLFSGKDPLQDVELGMMPAGAPEVPSREERAAFERLVRSVQCEIKSGRPQSVIAGG